MLSFKANVELPVITMGKMFVLRAALIGRQESVVLRGLERLHRLCPLSDTFLSLTVGSLISDVGKETVFFA